MVSNQGPISLFKKKAPIFDRKISEIIDIESQLDRFNNGKINLINVKKKMYETSLMSKSTIIQTLAEQKLSCVSDVDQMSLPIIVKTDWDQIRQQRMAQTHVGLVMIGVKGLHQKNLGTKTLVILFDNRWNDLSKSIIGSFEIDMNDNGAIIYFIPNFVMDTKECVQHLRIEIKTKGYNMVAGSLNLRITTGFIGKMQEHSNVKFKLNNEALELMLASQGIKAIEGKKFSSSVYAGTEWNLKGFLEKSILIPNESTSYENQDGTISMRFSDYHSRQNKHESDDDLESIQSELEVRRN